jgi:hypothetical protein
MCLAIAAYNIGGNPPMGIFSVIVRDTTPTALQMKSFVNSTLNALGGRVQASDLVA